MNRLNNVTSTDLCSDTYKHVTEKMPTTHIQNSTAVMQVMPGTPGTASPRCPSFCCLCPCSCDSTQYHLTKGPLYLPKPPRSDAVVGQAWLCASSPPLVTPLSILHLPPTQHHPGCVGVTSGNRPSPAKPSGPLPWSPKVRNNVSSTCPTPTPTP